MRFDLSGCGGGLDEPATSLLELGPFAERLGYDGLREVAIVGGPETVAARIADLHREFGFGGPQLVTGFLGNLPQEHVVRTLELFAAEILPRFRRGSDESAATQGSLR